MLKRYHFLELYQKMEIVMIRCFSFVYFLTFILSPLALSQLSGENNCCQMHMNDSCMPNERIEKIYLNPEDVIVEQECLYVVIEDHMIPATQINADEHGVFFTVDCYQPMGTWMCPRCGYTNTWFDSSCNNCPWPKTE